MNVLGPLYIWNFPDIENTMTTHRDSQIRLFLKEPAQAEMCMALIYCLMNPKPPGEYSVGMLHHLSRAYSLITDALGRLDRTQDYSLLWSINGLMIINSICRDWSSFETNLKGLNQVIAVLGGLETTMNANPIGCIGMLALQKSFATRSVHGDANIRPNKRSILRRSTSLMSAQSSLLPSVILPDELGSLVMQGEMRHDIAICLGEAILLLGRLRSGTWFEASPTSPKLSMELALLDLLEHRPLLFAEYTLCVGLLIYLVWQPPAVELRDGLWSDPIASWLIPEFAEVAKTTNLAKFKAPVLWTCMVIMELPVILGTTPGLRVPLFRDIVLEVSGQLTWRENRKTLARIYMDTKFDTLWGQCWEQILHPRSLPPSDKWMS